MIPGRGAVLAAALSGLTFLIGGAAHAKPPAKPAGAGPAGPKDKAALRLDSEALGKDYLETNFIKAEKKLQQAISLCGKNDACSTRVLAQLHRDLAVVYMAGLGKVDAGKEALKKALELDPSIELDPDYATPDLKKAWSALHTRSKKTEEPAVKAGITHTPVTEQQVRTPVPIFAKVGGPDAIKVRLWYKGVGAERWASAGMEAASGGFSGQIPCGAVAKEGDVLYFIEALNDADESVDKSGSRAEPYTVSIRKELSGDAPHLPDGSAPDRCKEGEGEESSGPAKPAGLRSNWFSISVQQDLAIIGAATDACAVGNQVAGSYSCFRTAGSQYLGNPLLGDPGDSVNAGLAPATTRILIGYDRVLVAGLTLGVRLGYVLRGMGPRADGGKAPFPWHVEARLAYWIGSDVFTTATFRPFVFVAGGAAQVDTRFGVVVNEDTSVTPPPSQPVCPDNAPPVSCNPVTQHLDAYRRMGQGFAGGGAGFMVAFAPAIGMFLDAKYMRLFPTAGNALSPELGLAIGF